MKLWQKDFYLIDQVEAFTVGEDPFWDMRLLKYDCLASIAHAEMLEKIGILTTEERELLTRELLFIKKKSEAGKFEIKREEEDGHTAIENHLTKKLGDAGKKIHTGRSRNDQVLTAMRLYYLDALAGLAGGIKELIQDIDRFQKRDGDAVMPGFTHTRKAMPSTTGLWAEAVSDAMKDNLSLMDAVRGLVDQSPLGSGAGYGVPINIDREFTASRLGFSRVQKNPIYCQSSRGKFEAAILHLLGSIMFDLNKTATDLIFFSLPELGFFELPDNVTPGSSIMPHKKNPDVLELLRANAHVVNSYEIQVKSLTANLISGYHRDFQLLKEPVIRSFDIVGACLAVTGLVFRTLIVNREKCKRAMTQELYSVERTMELVKLGIPFREAYRKTAAETEKI